MKNKVRLYNTLKRKKEIFKPNKPGKVGIYSCGPTVYWNQHIGHMYAYIQWDVLVRFFRYLGFEVNWVMNLTDVGHLTGDNQGDADTGEDKMEKGAKREGVSVWEIADKYIAQFLESIDLVNIACPDTLCRATEHINEQIELIKKMEKRGFIYKTKMGVVLDTSKFPGYADFANLNLEKQKEGIRGEIDPEKKNPSDFFLWVTGRPNHIMQWESPWGKGFPGWHLECTAMSTKYLGNNFDIHTGGQEHIAVHHTNEIAQAEAAFGRQTANYWLHNGWLTLKNTKMSKSLGNFVLVTDLSKKGFDPLAFRYLVLTSHYRQGLVFDWEALKSAQVAFEKLTRFLSGAKKKEKFSEKALEWKGKFIKALADDLGTPQALAVMWGVSKSNLEEIEKKALVLEFSQILGLVSNKKKEKGKLVIPKKIKNLAEKRAKLREKGDFKGADEARVEMANDGFGTIDLPEGYEIKKIKS